jgi:hypothetical protein
MPPGASSTYYCATCRRVTAWVIGETANGAAFCSCRCHARPSDKAPLVDYLDICETAIACSLCFAEHRAAQQRARRHQDPLP